MHPRSLSLPPNSPAKTLMILTTTSHSKQAEQILWTTILTNQNRSLHSASHMLLILKVVKPTSGAPAGSQAHSLFAMARTKALSSHPRSSAWKKRVSMRYAVASTPNTGRCAIGHTQVWTRATKQRLQLSLSYGGIATLYCRHVEPSGKCGAQ